MGIGGPSGQKLLKEVTTKFSDVEFSNDKNFFDVCMDIIDSQYHSRPELEEFIIKRLEGLFPNEKNYELVSLPWKCIFTTNYDTVLEKIPLEKFKNRTLRPVIENKPKIDLERYDLLYYIKMFGSIDAPYGEGKEGYPILSKTDYTTSFSRRKEYYKLLSDCIRQGPILFLGYSFEDGMVFDLMAELKQECGPDIIRKSYAIFPNKPSDKMQRMFVKYDINHIEGSLEQFVSIANKEFKDKKYEPVYAQKTMHIFGVPLDIPSTLERQSRENFVFLHSASMKSTIKDIKDFFYGEDSSFYPFQKQWDFIREVYLFDNLKPEKAKEYGPKVIDGLKTHIFKSFAESNSESNEITILTGQAGCGKTLILKRLAFDWYTRGQPVILMQPQGSNIDYRQVESFINYIEENERDKGGPTQKLRTLIICDHASSFYDEYRRLFENLTSRGKLISMVISDRENKLSQFNIKDYVTYFIPETVSGDELERFKEYLLSIKLIDSEEDLSGLIDNDKINNSFFALMYKIIDETHRPLNKIILDQYMNLSGWPKQVYEYVCLFNYYNINPNQELLVRSTIDDTELFKREVNEGKLKKVIFPVEAEWDNTDYRLHHHIIAQRTVHMKLNEPSIRVQKFTEILNHINPNLMHESKKIENLLVNKIGPNSNDREIPDDLKKEIFSIVCSKMDSRSIFHHYALLELEGDNKNFPHAKQLLDDALSVEDNQEPDELIYTSLGKYFSYLGYQLEDGGDIKKALDAYDSAEKYFNKGRHEYFRNVHSYHAQIVLNRNRADRSKDQLERIRLFTKAIDLCENAMGNLSTSYHDMFLEQEAKIAHLMGDLEEFESIVESLAIDYNSALGYKLKATLLFRDSFSLSGDQQTQTLEETYRIVEKGLRIDNKDQGLLKLKANIGINLFPTDVDKLYKILKDWFDLSDQSDLTLLFHYGKILFIKDYYENSLNVFKKLDYLSQGLGERTLITKSNCIKEKELKVYRGKITYVQPNSTKGLIKCTSLPNLKYDLRYLYTRFTPKVGDNVIFNICFNMRGIIAYDVGKN